MPCKRVQASRSQLKTYRELARECHDAERYSSDITPDDDCMSRFDAHSSGQGPQLPDLDAPGPETQTGDLAGNRWAKTETPRRWRPGKGLVLVSLLAMILPLAGGLAWAIQSGALDDPYARELDEGRLAMAEDRENEALEHFNKALGLRPGAYEPTLETAVVLFGLGQFDEARIWADRAVQGNPGSAEALNLRGLCHYHLGDIASSRADFTAAIAVAPDYPAAHLNLANLLVAEEDRLGAIRELEAFLGSEQGFPQEAQVRENLERLRRGEDVRAGGDGA